MKAYNTVAPFNSQSVTRRENPSALQRIQRPLTAALNTLGQQLLKSIMGSSEPRITAKRDRQGLSYFEVYDPVSGQHYTCSSEQEVRAWLEQRYYQR